MAHWQRDSFTLEYDYKLTPAPTPPPKKTATPKKTTTPKVVTPKMVPNMVPGQTFVVETIREHPFRLAHLEFTTNPERFSLVQVNIGVAGKLEAQLKDGAEPRPCRAISSTPAPTITGMTRRPEMRTDVADVGEPIQLIIRCDEPGNFAVVLHGTTLK